MTTVEVIRGARAALIKHGWARHVFRGQYGEVCIVQALRIAVNWPRCTDGETSSAYYAAWTKLEMLAGLPTVESVSLLRWNDHPSRTLDDVMKLLDKAEKSL